MKLAEQDLEQSFFQSVPKNTDKTVGFIFATLIVCFFFSLYLIGMYRVQTVSDHVVGDHLRASTAPISDIGDSDEIAPR